MVINQLDRKVHLFPGPLVPRKSSRSAPQRLHEFHLLLLQSTHPALGHWRLLKGVDYGSISGNLVVVRMGEAKVSSSSNHALDRFNGLYKHFLGVFDSLARALAVFKL